MAENIVPPTTPVPPVQQPAPVVPQEPLSPQPIQKKIPVIAENLKTKFVGLPKNTKIIVIIVAGLFLVILLLSVLVILFGKRTKTPTLAPTPTPISASPTPQVILNASRYATDSGVLKIETDLNNIQKQLDQTDVKQSDLKIPDMDFNINFNQ
ncbi:MAG TPA: hypothetical protein VLE44_02840 [Candidatus Saccharimonadales bacterium]|nr:hypothetical protein [Candidatus Saccharimonadales bacterium]